MERFLRSEGQASIEFVAVLPLILILGVVAWQLVLTGHTVWVANSAARAGARANALGKDPKPVASKRLSKNLRRGLKVRVDEESKVTVGVRIPAVADLFSLGRVHATAYFERQS